MHRPQQHYRRRLLDALVALRPQRVLEVGCGGGAFLRDATAADIAATGIDPDAAAVAALRAEGFDAHEGDAGALPLADGGADAVVFCYTAHHLPDWPRALREALRVARHGVLILDPWYEPGVPGQAVALAFDRWCKRIDRSTGMVHNDCMSAATLLAPLPQPEAFDIRIEYLLDVHELGPDVLAEWGQRQLRSAADPAPWRAGLAELQRQATAQGFSDDGAVMVSLRRR